MCPARLLVLIILNSYRFSLPASPPSGLVATGGTTTDINIAGINYRVHRFTSSSNFIVTTAGTLDWELVVAGGGGSGAVGGNNASGAGGAGGLLQRRNQIITAGTYAVTVGTGGGPGTGNSTLRKGRNGLSSAFNGQTTTGGGGGGAGVYRGGASINSGVNGGSGGGTGDTVNNTGVVAGTGVPGQGNDGGFRYGSGGGAGAAGTPNYGGGGAGLQLDITGTEVWYAVGGGPFAYSPIAGQSSGDLSNGGNQAQDGAANTGNGAGARWSSNVGKSGGSGVVIIRYII
jgi:hypothetical protein